MYEYFSAYMWNFLPSYITTYNNELRSLKKRNKENIYFVQVYLQLLYQ